jgi:hypothetical protein
MNIEKSFTFPFEDKQWTSKLGLGAVITIVPILNFAWSGYMVDIIRNVMNDVTEPLPTWDDLGRNFMEGLILFAASLIYALPMLLLLCLPLTIMGFSGVLAGDSSMEEIAQSIAAAGGALFFCLLCVFFLYALVLSVIYPAVLIMFARERTFASCFKLGEAFNMISRNAGPFFIAWGLSLATSLGVGLVMGTITTILNFIPCLGQILGLAVSLMGAVYIAVVSTHLFGQFGRAAVGTSQITVS